LRFGPRNIAPAREDLDIRVHADKQRKPGKKSTASFRKK
jgi:hypothetical protein